MDKPPFDELKQLAQTDPAAFERLRTRLIEDFIDSTDVQHRRRLRGLQFVIDARRGMAPNPVKALVEIQSMMHQSLQRLNGILHTRLDQPPGLSGYPEKAAVVPLHRNHTGP